MNGLIQNAYKPPSGGILLKGRDVMVAVNVLKGRAASAIGGRSAPTQLGLAPWPRLQCRSSSPGEAAVVFPLARVKNPNRLLRRVRRILLEETDLDEGAHS